MSETWSEDKISAYLDGELSPAERRQVESHLRSNPADRQKMAEMKRISQELRALPQHPLDKDLSGPIVAKLKRLTAIVEPLPEKQEPVVTRKPLLPDGPIDWRGAAAAIVALAALVLVALILAPPKKDTALANHELNESLEEGESIADLQLEIQEGTENADFATTWETLRKLVKENRLPEEAYTPDGGIRVDFLEVAPMLANTGSQSGSPEELNEYGKAAADAEMPDTESVQIAAIDRASEFQQAMQVENRLHAYDQVMVIRVPQQDAHLLAVSEIGDLPREVVNGSDRLAQTVENAITRHSGDNGEQTEFPEITDETISNADMATWSMFTVEGTEGEIRDLIEKIQGEKAVMFDNLVNELAVVDQPASGFFEEESDESSDSDEGASGQNEKMSKLGRVGLAAQEMTAMPTTKRGIVDQDSMVQDYLAANAADEQGQSAGDESANESNNQQEAGQDAGESIQDNADPTDRSATVRMLQNLEEKENENKIVRYLLIIQVDPRTQTSADSNDEVAEPEQDDD